jgi:phosphatidylserine/phosphatidylglycerophosphate/cardiolipin synthase-like enzyme
MKYLKRSIALLLLVFIAFFAAYHSYKPLPEGFAHTGQKFPASEVTFLGDNSWIDEAGNRQLDQEIFDAVFELIGEARRLVILDMFLFNDFQGPQPERHRLLSSELTAALLAQKAAYPDIRIVVITDPLNTIYGGQESEYFQDMRAAGIDVVMTDLAPLRDSNPIYSWFWRLFIRPFGNETGGVFPNPLGQGKVTARSYLALANFKANHRKTLFADTPSGYAGLVTSANPHDGSSAHRNTAIRFTGAAAIDLLKTENAVLALSGRAPIPLPKPAPQGDAEAYVQIVTERAIKASVLNHINAAGRGDQIDLIMFYLSEDDIIEALLAAKERGANLRLLLDPNKDAFGHEKDGVPNRPVAAKLHKQGIKIRWANVKGEQSHTKMLLITAEQEESVIIAGSANYTRRNINNYNLETNVVVTGPAEAEVLSEAQDYFETSWKNKDAQSYSLPYNAYADDSLLLRLKSGFMEKSGMSTF